MYAFYIMLIERMLSLALSAMMIALLETTVDRVVGLLAFRMKNSQKGMESAVTSYYTKAEKNLEEESRRNLELQILQKEVLNTMNDYLKSKEVKAAKTPVDSAASDSTCGSLSEDSVAVDYAPPAHDKSKNAG
jgi:hypothetical protein